MALGNVSAQDSNLVCAFTCQTEKQVHPPEHPCSVACAHTHFLWIQVFPIPFSTNQPSKSGVSASLIASWVWLKDLVLRWVNSSGYFLLPYSMSGGRHTVYRVPHLSICFRDWSSSHLTAECAPELIPAHLCRSPPVFPQLRQAGKTRMLKAHADQLLLLLGSTWSVTFVVHLGLSEMPSSRCYITRASSQVQSSLQMELHCIFSSKTLLREIMICRALRFVYLQSEMPTVLHSKNAGQNSWVEIKHVKHRSKLPLPCGDTVARSELCLWTKRACILLKFPHPHGKFYFLLNSVVKIGSKEIHRPKHCLDNIKGHVASKALRGF